MITIRNARPDDWEIIVRFNAEMAKETEDLDLDIPSLSEGIPTLLSDGSRGRYFIAEIDGRIVGQSMVTLEWSDWRNGFWWWFQSVYVLPEDRKSGVFRSLYEHIQSEAKKAGAPGLRLYVEKENEGAKRTYLAMGMDLSHYQMFEASFD